MSSKDAGGAHQPAPPSGAGRAPASPESPASDILARNLHALRRHERAARAVGGVEPYPESWRETARSGEQIISLPGEDGELRPLHSRHRPRDEARRALPEARDDDAVASFILLGGGLGYLPQEVWRTRLEQGSLIWVEDDRRLFRTLLELVDVSELLADARTTVLVGADARELQDHLVAHLRELLSGPLRVVGHPPSLQRSPASYAAHRRAIRDFIQEGSVQLRTAMYLSRYSLRNQMENLGAYVESPGYHDLAGTLRGQPAILVSAGPSLRKNIELLREAQGRITVIAVSTALRPLIARGIRPDFTALIDYHRVSRRYFEEIPADLAPPVVADLKATPEAVRAYAGVPLFGNDLIVNTLFAGIFGDRGDLPPGSTVAHVAYHFLRFLDADPVILVGQDLSYPGGIVHVPGTSIQTQEYPSSHRFHSLELRELEYALYNRDRFRKLPGNLGGEVPTDDVFFSYIREFERFFQEDGRRVINATEGGARLQGTEVSTLRAVLDEFRDARRPDFETTIATAIAGNPVGELRERARELLDRRRRELDELLSIYDRMLERIEHVVEENRAGRAADEAVAEVVALHRQSQRFGEVFLVLSSLVQSDGWTRLQADRRLDASRETGVERQLRQGERDREFIRGLRVAGEFLAECLATGAKSLEAGAVPA